MRIIGEPHGRLDLMGVRPHALRRQLELIPNNASEYVQSVPKIDSSWTISFKYSTYLVGLSGPIWFQFAAELYALPSIDTIRIFFQGEICLQTEVEFA